MHQNFLFTTNFKYSIILSTHNLNIECYNDFTSIYVKVFCSEPFTFSLEIFKDGSEIPVCVSCN